MHNSTLDLFCGHEDERNSIPDNIEVLAAENEVTVDYFLMEFNVNREIY